MKASNSTHKRRPSLWVAGPLCIIAGSLGSGADLTTQRFFTVALINVVFVMGLFTFIGNSGLLSFGHVGLAAVGGYVAAIVSIDPSVKSVLMSHLPGLLEKAHTGVILSVLIAAVVAAVSAVILSPALMRLAGLAVGLATFAVLEVVHNVANGWSDGTGGSTGVASVPTATTVWTAALWAAGCCVVAALYTVSRSGLLLRASRGDAVAAKASGIAVAFHRGAAFVLSAAMMGVGGALYVEYLGVVTPDTFFLDLTFSTLSMLIVGGIYSLSGAFAGVWLMSLIGELLRRLQSDGLFGLTIPERPGVQLIVFSLLLLAVLMVRPRGLFGGRVNTGSGGSRIMPQWLSSRLSPVAGDRRRTGSQRRQSAASGSPTTSE